jgi:hypothetical protein
MSGELQRFVFEVEIDCGLIVEVDAPDLWHARSAAAWAMKDHVAESCGGIEVVETTLKPECRVVSRADGSFDWEELEDA